MSACSSLDMQKKYLSFKGGYVDALGCDEVVSSDSDTIAEFECDSVEVIDETRIIDIAVGTRFGVVYSISPIPGKECFDIAQYITYPEIVSPSGKTSDFSSEWLGSRCVRQGETYTNTMSWFVEEEWEAAKGSWVFEIEVDDKIILRETFLAK